MVMSARLTQHGRENRNIIGTVPPPIEDNIIVAFGYAILQFEDTLYLKFQMLTRGIEVTRAEFEDHLQNMEERGLIASTESLGKACWVLIAGPDDYLRSW